MKEQVASPAICWYNLPMEILAIIPARGGSKGIPKKNLYPLAGKPLIVWTIEAAKQSKAITRVVVVTDSEEIAAVAKAAGADIPLMEPAELAGDTGPDLPVFEHTLGWLKKHEGYEPDLVVHLWATSPYRDPSHIDEAIQLLIDNPDADAVRSVTQPSQTPFKMWRRDKGPYLAPILDEAFPDFYAVQPHPHTQPRQTLPEVLVQTGYLAVLRRPVITERHLMFGEKTLPFYHDPTTYTEFDSMKDLTHAEYVLQNPPL